MNLQQLKAKYGTTTTATVTTPATTVTPATVIATPATPVKAAVPFMKSVSIFFKGGRELPTGPMYTAATTAMSNASAAVVTAATNTATTVRGVMPVTNNRFENAVGTLTEHTSNLDREVFNNKERTQALATAAGFVLPTDEELNVLYQLELTAMRQQVREELLEEQMVTLHQEAKEKAEKKAKKAIKKAKKAAKKEAEALLSPPIVTFTEVIKEIEVDEALVEQARAEINQVAATVVTEEVAEEVIVPAKKAKRFQCSTKVDGKRCTKKVTEQNGVCVACQTVVVVEVAVEEEVQPAKTSTRRKLGRQAPIAE